MAAKFDADRDLHAEIAGSSTWVTPHVIVEVPPGQTYCAARKALWGLIKKEPPANSRSTIHVMGKREVRWRWELWVAAGRARARTIAKKPDRIIYVRWYQAANAMTTNPAAFSYMKDSPFPLGCN